MGVRGDYYQEASRDYQLHIAALKPLKLISRDWIHNVSLHQLIVCIFAPRNSDAILPVSVSLTNSMALVLNLKLCATQQAKVEYRGRLGLTAVVGGLTKF